MKRLIACSLIVLSLAPAALAKASAPREETTVENPNRLPGPWWDDRTAGLYGGIGGSVLGCLGGLIGTLAGVGKARRFVLALMTALVVLGVVLLIAGLVAVAQSQPYAVYYPLLLTGGLCAVLMGSLLPGVRRRYAQIELRRISAADATAP